MCDNVLMLNVMVTRLSMPQGPSGSTDVGFLGPQKPAEAAGPWTLGPECRLVCLFSFQIIWLDDKSGSSVEKLA